RSDHKSDDEEYVHLSDVLGWLVVVKRESHIAVIAADEPPHVGGPGCVGRGVENGPLAKQPEHLADFVAGDPHLDDAPVVSQTKLDHDFSGTLRKLCTVQQVIPS